MATTLHRKPRSGGVPTVDVLPSRVSTAPSKPADSSSSSSSSKARHSRKHAPSHAAPLKQRRLGTTQLRALCAACLLVYLGALYFAEDIVRIGAAARSDAARQRLFSPWRPVRSAVTAAVAATRPLLRSVPEPANEPDDDAADEDNVRAAVETATLAPVTEARQEAEQSIVPAESVEREATAAGTVPPTPAGAVPAELEGTKADAKEQKADAETTEKDTTEDDSVVPVLDEEAAAEKVEAAESTGVVSTEKPEVDELRRPPTAPVIVSEQDRTAHRLADERRSPPSEAVESEHELTPTTDRTLPSLGERRSPPSEVVRADRDHLPVSVMVVETTAVAAVSAIPAATPADATATLSRSTVQASPEETHAFAAVVQDTVSLSPPATSTESTATEEELQLQKTADKIIDATSDEHREDETLEGVNQ